MNTVKMNDIEIHFFPEKGNKRMQEGRKIVAIINGSY